jgi:hypothetical protein
MLTQPVPDRGSIGLVALPRYLKSGGSSGAEDVEVALPITVRSFPRQVDDPVLCGAGPRGVEHFEGVYGLFCGHREVGVAA